MKLQEDKTRFINNLPWISDEEKQKVLDFFKSHANLESKIQNWQSRDKEGLVKEIRNLISEVEKASLAKEKAKQGYRGNIDWEAHECKYLGEDEDWIYVTPLSYEGAKFCDSAACGGAGAKWCIGYEKSDQYWKNYLRGNALFLMKFNKYPKNKQRDLKFMIEGYPERDEVDIWNQKDHSKDYTLSETEKGYLRTIQKIQDETRRELIAKYFDNPESGVYIAKNEEALKYIQDIKKDLRVFKAKEEVILKNVENAQKLFRGCKSLISVDTSVFRNVKSTYQMFEGCTSLTSIDTSAFKNVEDARCMFQDCTSLTSIDTSAFVNVKDAFSMFTRCTSLTSIDTSAFVNVTDASNMFAGCKSLTSIDTSAFVNVEDASGMFRYCTSLASIDTSAFANVRNVLDMFAGCKSLTSIDTSAFVNVTDARGMFSDCASLTSIDTSAFVNVTDASNMFAGCKSLTSIDTSVFKNVKYARGMFWGCTSLKTYISGSNGDVNGALEKIGAKPVKRLGESFRRRVIEEILEE